MKTDGEIEIVHANLRQSISNLYEVMDFVEESNQFQEQLDKDLRGLFYHLYTKCKRNFQAISILMNSKELSNSYVESTVLLRVMTEGYLHMCYMMETKKEKLLKEYEALSNNKLKKMLNPNSSTYRLDIKSKEDQEHFKNMRRSLKGKDTEIPIHFKRMDILAKKTKNENFYNTVYQMFNTYVHFNPTTYISYGIEDSEGNFTYNSFTPKPYLEARIIYHSVNIQMLLLKKICMFLKIEKAPQNIVHHFSDWEKFIVENRVLIFDSTNDFL